MTTVNDFVNRPTGTGSVESTVQQMVRRAVIMMAEAHGSSGGTTLENTARQRTCSHTRQRGV